MAAAEANALGISSIPFAETPATYYITVLATASSGAKVAAASQAVSVDLTPPVFFDSGRLSCQAREALVPQGNGSTFTKTVQADTGRPCGREPVHYDLHHVENGEPVVLQVKYQSYNDAVAAVWEAVDQDSSISFYEIKIASSLSATALPWTNIGLSLGVVRRGLSLAHGSDYCVTVRATNGAGMTTEASAPCVTVDLTPPNAEGARLATTSAGSLVIAGLVSSGRLPRRRRFASSAVQFPLLTGATLDLHITTGNYTEDFSGVTRTRVGLATRSVLAMADIGPDVLPFIPVLNHGRPALIRLQAQTASSLVLGPDFQPVPFEPSMPHSIAELLELDAFTLRLEPGRHYAVAVQAENGAGGTTTVVDTPFTYLGDTAAAGGRVVVAACDQSRWYDGGAQGVTLLQAHGDATLTLSATALAAGFESVTVGLAPLLGNTTENCTVAVALGTPSDAELQRSIVSPAAHFRPYLADPAALAAGTVDMERILLGRVVSSTGIAFWVSPLGRMAASAPLTVDITVDTTIFNVTHAVPLLVYYDADAKIWRDAAATCPSQLGSVVLHPTGVQASICGRPGSNGAGYTLGEETLFAVVVARPAASNTPPHVADLSLETNVNTILADIPLNATDPEGDSLLYSLASLPAPGTGTATVGANGTVTFVPAPFFAGSTSFKIRVVETFPDSARLVPISVLMTVTVAVQATRFLPLMSPLPARGRSSPTFSSAVYAPRYTQDRPASLRLVVLDLNGGAQTDIALSLAPDDGSVRATLLRNTAGVSSSSFGQAYAQSQCSQASTRGVSCPYPWSVLATAERHELAAAFAHTTLAAFDVTLDAVPGKTGVKEARMLASVAGGLFAAEEITLVSVTCAPNQFQDASFPTECRNFTLCSPGNRTVGASVTSDVTCISPSGSGASPASAGVAAGAGVALGLIVLVIVLVVLLRRRRRHGHGIASHKDEQYELDTINDWNVLTGLHLARSAQLDTYARWLHVGMDSSAAEDALREEGATAGSFLVYTGSKNDSRNILCVCTSDGELLHVSLEVNTHSGEIMLSGNSHQARPANVDSIVGCLVETIAAPLSITLSRALCWTERDVTFAWAEAVSAADAAALAAAAPGGGAALLGVSERDEAGRLLLPPYIFVVPNAHENVARLLVGMHAATLAALAAGAHLSIGSEETGADSNPYDFARRLTHRGSEMPEMLYDMAIEDNEDEEDADYELAVGEAVATDTLYEMAIEDNEGKEAADYELAVGETVANETLYEMAVEDNENKEDADYELAVGSTATTATNDESPDYELALGGAVTTSTTDDADDQLNYELALGEDMTTTHHVDGKDAVRRAQVLVFREEDVEDIDDDEADEEDVLCYADTIGTGHGEDGEYIGVAGGGGNDGEADAADVDDVYDNMEPQGAQLRGEDGEYIGVAGGGSDDDDADAADVDDVYDNMEPQGAQLRGEDGEYIGVAGGGSDDDDADASPTFGGAGAASAPGAVPCPGNTTRGSARRGFGMPASWLLLLLGNVALLCSLVPAAHATRTTANVVQGDMRTTLSAVGRLSAARHNNDLAHLFDVFDRDSSTNLDRTELLDLLSHAHAGVDITRAALAAGLLRALDTRSPYDGLIDLSEFTGAFSAAGYAGSGAPCASNAEEPGFCPQLAQPIAMPDHCCRLTEAAWPKLVVVSESDDPARTQPAEDCVRDRFVECIQTGVLDCRQCDAQYGCRVDGAAARYTSAHTYGEPAVVATAFLPVLTALDDAAAACQVALRVTGSQALGEAPVPSNASVAYVTAHEAAGLGFGVSFDVKHAGGICDRGCLAQASTGMTSTPAPAVLCFLARLDALAPDATYEAISGIVHSPPLPTHAWRVAQSLAAGCVLRAAGGVAADDADDNSAEGAHGHPLASHTAAGPGGLQAEQGAAWDAASDCAAATTRACPWQDETCVHFSKVLPGVSEAGNAWAAALASCLVHAVPLSAADADADSHNGVCDATGSIVRSIARTCAAGAGWCPLAHTDLDAVFSAAASVPFMQVVLCDVSRRCAGSAAFLERVAAVCVDVPADSSSKPTAPWMVEVKYPSGLTLDAVAAPLPAGAFDLGEYELPKGSVSGLEQEYTQLQPGSGGSIAAVSSPLLDAASLGADELTSAVAHGVILSELLSRHEPGQPALEVGAATRHNRYFRAHPVLAACIASTRAAVAEDVQVVRAYETRSEAQARGRLSSMHRTGAAATLAFAHSNTRGELLRLAAAVVGACLRLVTPLPGVGLGLGLGEQSLDVVIVRVGANDAAQRVRGWTTGGDALPGVDFAAWVQSLEAQDRLRIRQSTCLPGQLQKTGIPAPLALSYDNGFDAAMIAAETAASGATYLRDETDFCRLSAAARLEGFLDLWSKLEPHVLNRMEEAALRGVEPRRSLAEVQQALRTCYLTCDGGDLFGEKANERARRKIKACDAFVHWLPLPLHVSHDACHLHVPGNARMTENACFWGQCIDRQPSFALLDGGLQRFFQQEIEERSENDPAALDPAPLFGEGRNPTPLYKLLNRAYAMECTGRVTVWVQNGADVLALRDALRAAAVFNPHVTSLDVRVPEMGYVSAAGALENLVMEWTTTLCTSHTRTHVAPYSLAFPEDPRADV